ncbi:MAG TPA: S26 family signal peptidase [Terriglobales bacterium]|nr:S26 family signal peptidase [Terriglobales bacterium]
MGTMIKQSGKAPSIGPKPKETTVDFLASMAGTFVALLFFVTFVVQAFAIPSSSMENTLLIGDHVFVNANAACCAVRGRRILAYYDLTMT